MRVPQTVTINGLIFNRFSCLNSPVRANIATLNTANLHIYELIV